jgi:hypothetical protein
MKKLALGAAVGLALALAPVGVGVAQASSATASVIVETNAQYDIQGSILHVGVKATCSGGAGAVTVQVTQSSPETPYPVAFGSGPNAVVCDGQQHETAVTIHGEGFDAGKATATATLTVTDPAQTELLATDTDTQQINIVVA